MITKKEFINYVYNSNFDIITDNKGVRYYNIECGFDIEVSSFYDDENKVGLMYLWGLGIKDKITYGRTWEEFFNLLDIISYILDTNNTRLIIFVQNLSYEFQFIRKRVKWSSVFILEDRKILKCEMENGIQLRCSYKLSNKSLANMAKDLKINGVEKKTGQLDYKKLRTPITKLKYEELEYLEYDVLIILFYIRKKISEDGNILLIPLTNTGYVRNYCRKNCYKRWKKYKDIMLNLSLDYDEYLELKMAFQGGFTHANAKHVDKILTNVTSFDIVSSYPTVDLLEKFPMSKSKVLKKKLTKNELYDYLYDYCCLINITFYNIVSVKSESPISISKCFDSNDVVVNNGRVVSANYISIIITEQDFFVYKEFYDWEEIFISSIRYYEKNYLPKELIMSIIKFYVDKTTLKDVDEEEVNYMISKNMLNASYGMMVTDIIKQSIKYINDVFVEDEMNFEELIKKYNNSKKRFLFYPWGVWTTAYARANLFSIIKHLGNDYVYSDTDSVKILNADKYKKFFDNYNKNILKKIDEASKYHGIDKTFLSPKNKYEVKKTIGIWENEGTYKLFKTLGAKRYIYCKEKTEEIEDNGLTVQLTKLYLNVTIAGVNKKTGSLFLRKTLKPFENFKEGLIFPPDYSGKLTLTYIDEERKGVIKDYQGNYYEYDELSSIFIENSEYELSRTQEFINYLRKINDMEFEV